MTDKSRIHRQTPKRSKWIMQSSESGGHGASPASLVSFIPELVDHVEHLCQELGIQPAVPVAAAGGITDARQVSGLPLVISAVTSAAAQSCFIERHCIAIKWAVRPSQQA